MPADSQTSLSDASQIDQALADAILHSQPEAGANGRIEGMDKVGAQIIDQIKNGMAEKLNDIAHAMAQGDQAAAIVTALDALNTNTDVEDETENMLEGENGIPDLTHLAEALAGDKEEPTIPNIATNRPKEKSGQSREADSNQNQGQSESPAPETLPQGMPQDEMPVRKNESPELQPSIANPEQVRQQGSKTNNPSQTQQDSTTENAGSDKKSTGQPSNQPASANENTIPNNQNLQDKLNEQKPEGEQTPEDQNQTANSENKNPDETKKSTEPENAPEDEQAKKDKRYDQFDEETKERKEQEGQPNQPGGQNQGQAQGAGQEPTQGQGQGGENQEGQENSEDQEGQPNGPGQKPVKQRSDIMQGFNAIRHRKELKEIKKQLRKLQFEMKNLFNQLRKFDKERKKLKKQIDKIQPSFIFTCLIMIVGGILFLVGGAVIIERRLVKISEAKIKTQELKWELKDLEEKKRKPVAEQVNLKQKQIANLAARRNQLINDSLLSRQKQETQS